MPLTEKEFREEANKVTVNLMPILPNGVEVHVKLKEFSERLDLIESRVLAIDADVDKKIKSKVAMEARQRLIDYIEQHNKRVQDNKNKSTPS